jgi:hypothetical protein
MLRRRKPSSLLSRYLYVHFASIGPIACICKEFMGRYVPFVRWLYASMIAP